MLVVWDFGGELIYILPCGWFCSREVSVGKEVEDGCWVCGFVNCVNFEYWGGD